MGTSSCACVHVCMRVYVHVCMCACVHVCMCAGLRLCHGDVFLPMAQGVVKRCEVPSIAPPLNLFLKARQAAFRFSTSILHLVHSTLLVKRPTFRKLC